MKDEQKKPDEELTSSGQINQNETDVRIFANYEHRILPSVNTKFYLP